MRKSPTCYGETGVMDFDLKQTIQTNRINKVNTIKQTPQSKNSSIIVSFRQPYTKINRPQYIAE